MNFLKFNEHRILIGDKYLKFLSFINLPWGPYMSYKKFGPDRLSRFDVYWIQTKKQTPRHPDQPNLFIEYYDGVYIYLL